jgi:hypothetical protein
MVTNILSTTQSALSAGYGLLGGTLGEAYEWYQPISQWSPISPRNDEGEFLCLFDRDAAFPARRASDYGKPLWFVAYDRGGPSVGDYLVGADATHFIIDQASLTPSLTVKCNAVLSFYRPGGDTTASTVVDPSPADGTPNPYEYFHESDRPNEGQGDGLATFWPVSLLQGPKGEKFVDPNLPESTRDPWWVILCPIIPNVHFITGDRAEDANGNRYKISSPELSTLGWRLTAELVEVGHG